MSVFFFLTYLLVSHLHTDDPSLPAGATSDPEIVIWSIVMLLFLWLSVSLSLATACVDIIFVVDPQDERALGRAIKVANDVEKHGLHTAAVTNRAGRILTRLTKNTADLITTLESVSGPYDRFLDAVSVEILRRRSEKTLIVLLFTEKDVNSTLIQNWKDMKHTPVFVFRVGNAKAVKELFEKETMTFNKLIECKQPVVQPNSEIRRRQPKNETESKTSSATTIRSTTTRASRKPGPVFKGTTSAPKVTTTVRIATDVTQQAKTHKQEKFRGVTTTTKRPEIVILKTTTKKVTSTARSASSTTTTKATTPRPLPGCVVDVLFLVDFSRGTGEHSQSYFDIAASAVGVLPIGPEAVRVAMVGYSGPGRATTLFHLDKHEGKDDLIEELFRMQSSGGTTRTAEAIRYARTEFANMKHGARKGAKKFIVLFTDGYSQDNPVDAANEARRDGIQIITVSLSAKYGPNEEELRRISGSKELVLISPKGQQIREKILGRSCAL